MEAAGCEWTSRYIKWKRMESKGSSDRDRRIVRELRAEK